MFRDLPPGLPLAPLDFALSHLMRGVATRHPSILRRLGAHGGARVLIDVTDAPVLMLMVALGLTAALGRVRWTLLGGLTYPLYLLHENIGFMVFNAAYPRWNAHLLFWGTLGAMLLASAAIERWVSRQLTPALKAGFAGASRRLGRMPTA